MKKKRILQRSLDRIEFIGNKLPHPVTLFALLALLVLILSAVLSQFNISVEHPGEKGKMIEVTNLLNKEGIQYIFLSITDNFIYFAPLGIVLVTMLGIGVAESTGLISAVLRGFVLSIPKSLITAALVFAGVMSSVASDAGYVVLPPLGAVIFAGLGRHPLAGLAAAFAGVSGGFSANLILTSLDPLLAGMTMDAVMMVDPAYVDTMNVAMNLYFIIASVFLLTFVGWFVTEKIVEPRLGEYTGKYREDLVGLKTIEKKGLRWSGISALVVIIGVALLVIPENAALRAIDDGSGDFTLMDSLAPFMNSLVPIIALLFFVPGLVYGKVTKAIKNDKDVSNMLAKTMGTMGTFIVLAFTAGQFVAFFAKSNMGLVVGVAGANFLEKISLTGIPLLLVFIVICAFINLFIGSASAKWAMMAPIFVPIMMHLGYSPELTQMAYRIADSSTNMITPLMTYFALIIAFAQKYDKKMGIGTMISTMIPYSMFFLLSWTILLIVWILFGIDLGPGAPVFYP